MAGRIPRDFIDQLLSRLDIVELIDSRVKLKKAGKNYHACCPFHNEKTPSFTVSRDKQFYHCFGCGAHGNAIDFVMEYDRLEFPDAIEELANQAGLEVVREQSPHNQGRSSAPKGPKFDDHFDMMNWAARYYQQQLRQHSEKQKVIDYLKQRGLDGETAKKFGIGFAPPGWDNLIRQHNNAKAQIESLDLCGMLIRRDDDSHYDRFRDRLMFPIQDRRGRVVAFGGRVLGDDTPKYLNSPETPIFHKGKELYGLHQVRQAHRNPERILVVEGYMDVVALAQNGVDYAVASLGTSTTTDQIQILLRTADKEVICCYDGDRAGRQAAWRAMETALPQLRKGKAIKFMFLPDGEDPDTLIRQEGQHAFEKRVNAATPLSQYFFDTLLKDAELNSHEGRSRVANQATPLIEQIQDEELQQLMFEELAKAIKTNYFGLEQYRQATKARPQQAVNTKASQGRGTPLRRAVALLLQHPQLGYQLEKQVALDHLTLNGIELLNTMLDHCYDAPLTTAQLMERFRDTPEYAMLRKLMARQVDVKEHVEKEFFDCLQWLNQRFLEQLSEALNQKARDGTITTDEVRQLHGLNQTLEALRQAPRASDH